MRYTLVVGTKDWSSWSLRAYAALRATGVPFDVCCGSVNDSADDRMRRPVDPVSTSTPSIVWQLDELPGTQIVTLVKTPFA